MKRILDTQNDGQDIEAITLSAGALSATILTRGAILHDVRLKGVPHSLTLGSADVAAYDAELKYFGALVGPLANRISNAKAPLEGRILDLCANEGTTSLHGGPNGMHTQIWTVTELQSDRVTLELKLADGIEGYPGNRTLKAQFSITAPAQLTLEVSATTDAPTLINIANHSYWNLDGTASMAGHVLTICADAYTPIDAQLIPTGKQSVEGTDFDLRAGAVLGLPDAQRFDHNFCLNGVEGDLKHACTLTGQSGVSMRIDTTEVGLQVFDAGGMSSGNFTGHMGDVYGAFCGVALEAQRWPDAPNQDGFPSCVLRPEDTYKQTTSWTFSRG